MRNHLFLAILLSPLLALSSLAQQREAQPKAAITQEDEVVATMHSIRAAVAAGDTERWELLVSPSCEFVEPSGHFATRRWHRPAKSSCPGTTPDTTLSEVSARVQGDSAFLSYRQDAKTHFGDQTIQSATRYTEIYERTSEKWQLVFSAETPIVEKTPVRMDPKLYEDYVGEYQMAPGLIGRVYRESDRLWLIGTGWKQPYELLPVGNDTFFLKAMPDNEIYFARDTAGKVISQTGGSRGQELTGKKIK